MSKNKLAGIIAACTIAIIAVIVLVIPPLLKTSTPTLMPTQDGTLVVTEAKRSEIEWIRAPGKGCARAIRHTADGGYILAGVGSGGICLIKADSSGKTEWQKTFVGNYGWSVQQTADGGYVITGEIQPDGAPNNKYDAYVIKTDSSGNKEWDKTFGGADYDAAHYIQQTTDGGYIVVGATASYGERGSGSNVWLVKIDCSGDMQWGKTFGGSGRDKGWSVHQTADGGYIVSGNTEDSGATCAIYLVKTDSLGNMQWEKSFGTELVRIFDEEEMRGWNYGYSVQQTTDGGYIAGGSTSSSRYGVGDHKAYLLKVDSSGNKQWEESFASAAGDSAFYYVQQASDGGYIAVEGSYLLKTDFAGNEEWRRYFGGVAYSGQQILEGGDYVYVVAGDKAFSDDILLVKFSSFKVKKQAYGGGQIEALDLENEYLPVVVACENGDAPYEALKAQAVVSRTFALYKRQVEPRSKNYDVLDSEADQVYNPSVFAALPQSKQEEIKRAVKETNQILQYGDDIICTFFVSGTGNTAKYVTFNEGKEGNAITQTSLGRVTSPPSENPHNRGCMGQVQANELASEGYTFRKILQYFYGSDIKFIPQW